VQDTDSEESKRCRFCFEPSSEVEGEQSGELISPCACKGTQQYVHKSCLARWQEVLVRVRVRVRTYAYVRAFESARARARERGV